MRTHRTLALVTFLGLVAARSAAANAEAAAPEELRGGERCCSSSLMCEVGDDAADGQEDQLQPVGVTWQSPPPAELSCEDELFSSAVGICDGAVVARDDAPPARPPLSCDGVSCFPDDSPLPPARPLFSYSHPIALVALVRAPLLASAELPVRAEPRLAAGVLRRIERPPRIPTGSR